MHGGITGLLPTGFGALSNAGSVVGVVLSGAAHIDCSKSELQRDQSISMIVPAPDHPEKVAGEKSPEAPLSAPFCLRTHPPCCENSCEHGRPLQEIHWVHDQRIAR